METIDASYNFNRVSPQVTTSGVVGAKRLADLGAQGYDVVINLLPDESEHAVADEAGIVTRQGLSYVYVPVDFASPTAADFEAFSRAMDQHAGQTMHVHCAANFRVSAFYGLYAVAQGLMSVAEADELMKPFWNPADFPAWAEFITRQRAALA